MRLLTKLISAAFLLSLAMPAVLMAQDEADPPNLATVWIVHPKAGHFGEFMAAVTEHMAFRKEQGDTRGWNVYQPVIGDDIGKVAFRYCCFDWADEDAYAAAEAEKGLGDHWNANVDQHVGHYEHYLSAIDLDNSHVSEAAFESATLFGVTTWNIAPGKGADFDAMKAKMSTLAKENGWASDERNWSWSSRIGGKPEESIVIPHKDYADMAPPEETFYEFVVGQIGEEAANEMFATFSKSASSSRYTVWQLNPDLSIDSGE
jgi:hypothetical protein